MAEIEKTKHQEIQHLLRDLEMKKGIKIIHTVESGSRAWGFPSKDSGYDVRIIYHHEQEWYISPFDKEAILLDKAKQREKDTFKIPNNLWSYSIKSYERVSTSFSEKKKQGKQDDYEKLLRKIVM